MKKLSIETKAISELRPYQDECVRIINKLETGRHLVVMATGLGKTVVFSHIERKNGEKVLILSHREELVLQPLSYYEHLPVGAEQGQYVSDKQDVVVSASVQSLANRLDKFDRTHFGIIIIDEAHHACADSYQDVLKYFKPRLVIGFTATPFRMDGKTLPFEDTVFERDIFFGIQNGYLADVKCQSVNLKFDLSGCRVRKQKGDLCQKQLSRIMNKEALVNGVVKAYLDCAADRQTMVFAVDKQHANALKHAFCKEHIKAECVTDETSAKDRHAFVSQFRNKEIRVLINVMVFTEGTDIPETECVLLARPTMSKTLYTQMVGRGLRTCQNKKDCLILDIVGNAGRHPLCSPVDLLPHKTEKDRTRIHTDSPKSLRQIEQELALPQPVLSTPKDWLTAVKHVAVVWNTHDIHFTQFRHDFFIAAGQKDDSYDSYTIQIHRISKEQPFYSVLLRNQKNQCRKALDNAPLQDAFDKAFHILTTCFQKSQHFWNLAVVLHSEHAWGLQKASPSQKTFIRKNRSCLPQNTVIPRNLNKYQASVIIQNMKWQMLCNPSCEKM